jgi:putative transposase
MEPQKLDTNFWGFFMAKDGSIEFHYYNNDRITLKLKGLSPVQYRTQPLAV